MGGLYEALPTVLPFTEGHIGSGFTHRLSNRFPQLRPLDDRKAEFGGYWDAKGYIRLTAEDKPTHCPDHNRRVVAKFGYLGADLLNSRNQRMTLG